MKTFFSFTLSILILFLFTYFSPFVSAQSKIESPNYRIQFPNFNSGAGIPSSSNFKLDSTLGQGAPGLYSSAGYKVKAGFQYIHSIIPFSFSISKIQINFGSLTVGTPSTDTSTLTVSAGGAGGYSVKASENNPLKTFNSINTIPDTLCDSTCSETAAAVWTSNSKYGFGFNMTGDDIPADFTNSTYFRQFADTSNSESKATIMSSINVGRSRVATITYKINVSNTQPAGTYQNIIMFTAIPGY
ncbi:MAG: hypothetical protein Q7T59_01835 [Candidatus Woesebacteria bacterium]|nr:hypothetical protein [Candidatus Woesebacteria bacterium]